VPEKNRAKNINEIDLSEESTVERALGEYWFIEDDKLGFHINVKNQPPTLRLQNNKADINQQTRRLKAFSTYLL
jgi:hypothetical protein